MATRKCKDCGQQVSKRAKQCPHCGAPAKKKSGCLGVVALFFVMVLIIGVISAALDDSSSPAPPAPAAPAPAPEQPQAESQPPPVSSAEANTDTEVHASQPLAPVSATTDWKARHAELKARYLPDFKPPAVGSPISLTFKVGSPQEGVLKSLTDSEVQIERDGTTIGFSLSQLSTKSRVRCFASDYASYKAYREVKQEKDAFAAKESAREAALEAKRAAERAAERTKRIESCFSSWNGSHIRLVRLIKEAMHDPKSFKHVETRYGDRGDHLLVHMSYRGKNAFGALVLNSVTAKCDLDGNVIEIVAQEP